MDDSDINLSDTKNNSAIQPKPSRIEYDQSGHDGVWLIAAGAAIGLDITLSTRSPIDKTP